MKKFFIRVAFLAGFSALNAQTADKLENFTPNSADRLLTSEDRLSIGGYGEVHYNQPIEVNTRNNGKLDVHRIVLLLGYNFNNRTRFITEIEFEHVKEVYIEQAFLQFKINEYLNFKGGLFLIPMGIINEYHEPVTFNGVERPQIDKYISPTTWREIGFGFTGNILSLALKYQAYLVNGFNGFDGEPHLSGKNGLRKGRQKGAESFMSSPCITGKAEYYGVRGLNIGFSGYFGKTQSTLYDGIDKDQIEALETADSSITGISMIGADARYSVDGIQLRGQFYYTGISNTKQYNIFTANEEGTLNDLGSSMTGFYLEAGYNVLRLFNGIKQQLVPFFRYEMLDTHHTVENIISRKKEYKKGIITTGLTWTLAKGAVLKADIQLQKSAVADTYSKVFNAGFGVMF